MCRAIRIVLRIVMRIVLLITWKCHWSCSRTSSSSHVIKTDPGRQVVSQSLYQCSLGARSRTHPEPVKNMVDMEVSRRLQRFHHLRWLCLMTFSRLSSLSCRKVSPGVAGIHRPRRLCLNTTSATTRTTTATTFSRPCRLPRRWTCRQSERSSSAVPVYSASRRLCLITFSRRSHFPCRRTCPGRSSTAVPVSSAAARPWKRLFSCVAG
mmetsp:Transcript_77116/g.139172  ORF Transcript_77116/g.139172 Transcript_77116/m.139172 type:complete len:209 (+) Transcript_77116:167-793(+)